MLWTFVPQQEMQPSPQRLRHKIFELCLIFHSLSVVFFVAVVVVVVHSLPFVGPHFNQTQNTCACN